MKFAYLNMINTDSVTNALNYTYSFLVLKCDSLHESLFQTKLIKEKMNKYFKLYEQLGTLNMFNTISV